MPRYAQNASVSSRTSRASPTGAKSGLYSEKSTYSRIAADTKRMIEAGCAGVDLLAFRATDADPLALIRAARAATDRTVVVAGSINSAGRVREIADAGADLFTIGTAALDGSFSPRHGLLANQLRRILDACRVA